MSVMRWLALRIKYGVQRAACGALWPPSAARGTVWLGVSMTDSCSPVSDTSSPYTRFAHNDCKVFAKHLHRNRQ
jgi:hypothetical protein